ncbi:MAG: hypothetical protein K0R78_3204 [Pelosinus sp.]|jgi:hypothetical protein|nr:hypothetical protein [Pelosinus sp.]
MNNVQAEPELSSSWCIQKKIGLVDGNKYYSGCRYLVDKQIEHRVEVALYNYPMWKVNLLNITPTEGTKENILGVFREDYQMGVKIIEATLSNFSTLEQNFVKYRYSEKKPFKIIADELSMTERHLYRIRKKIINQLAVAFGEI